MPKDEKEKLVPNLRFKGFTDDWILYKLKDVSKRITRKNKEQIANIPLTISDKFGLIDQREYFTKKIASKDMSHYILLKKGEFAYNKSYSKKNIFGTVARLDNYDMGALSTLYIAFEVENADSTFIQKYYESDKWHYGISKIANEGARNHGLLNISTQDFFDTRIKTPNNLDEQTKIGIILEKLDNIITLEQEKLIKYEQAKENMLTKLFPIRECKIPELRFKSFNDNWIQRPLSEISNIVGGGTPSTKIKEYWFGDINWFTPTEIGKDTYVISSNRKITKLGFDKSAAKLLPKDKTILFTSRAGIGDTAILKEDASTNQGFQSLIVNDNTDIYFLFSLTETIKREAIRRASGSTFLEISRTELGKINIAVPTYSEQVKVGLLLEYIDNIITLEQARIEHYRSIKKNLLYNLFI